MHKKILFLVIILVNGSLWTHEPPRYEDIEAVDQRLTRIMARDNGIIAELNRQMKKVEVGVIVCVACAAISGVALMAGPCVPSEYNNQCEGFERNPFWVNRRKIFIASLASAAALYRYAGFLENMHERLSKK